MHKNIDVAVTFTSLLRLKPKPNDNKSNIEINFCGLIHQDYRPFFNAINLFIFWI